MADAHSQLSAEVLFELLPKRRPRANPRVLKRKMSRFGVKRPEHCHPPTPVRTVHVLGAAER
jgi:hypothetical protein